jgi:predicted RND superfamily exporter protein
MCQAKRNQGIRANIKTKSIAGIVLGINADWGIRAVGAYIHRQIDDCNPTPITVLSQYGRHVVVAYVSR